MKSTTLCYSVQCDFSHLLFPPSKHSPGGRGRRRHSSSSTMDLRDRSLLFGLARPPASPKSMEMTTGQPRACAASPDSCRHKETRIHLPSDINMYTLSCHEQRHTSLHFSSKLCLQYYSTQHCHETSSCICCSGRTLVNFQLNSFNPGSLGILG